MWELDCEEGWGTEELMLFNCGVGEDSLESLGLQGDPTSPFWRRSALGILWWDWCWSWNSNTLATWCEELTHWKRLWCWEGLGARAEGDDRGWDGWMASLTRWTWGSVNSGSWWWTGRPGVLRFMGSQRVRHDWATELNCKIWVYSYWTKTPLLKGTCFYAQSLSRVQVFATLWTIACQAPLSMGFSRQYWSGLPFPSPGLSCAPTWKSGTILLSYEV